MNAAIDCIGRDWLERRVLYETEVLFRELRGSRRRRHEYVRGHPSPHPAVPLVIEAKAWQKECERRQDLKWSAAAARLAVIGHVLAATQSQQGFSRIAKDLKNSAKFEGAIFEAEVACGYLEAGASIEFVDESEVQSPDLRVILATGVQISVECKAQRQETQRDIRVREFSQDLAARLLDHMRWRTLNYCVVIAAREDPTLSQAAPLARHISDLLDNDSNNDPPAGAFIPLSPDPTNLFEVGARRLTRPNEEQDGPLSMSIVWSDFDNVYLSFESKNSDSAVTRIRNPRVIGFRNLRRPDREIGVINAFKNAVDQLPKSGPGVVWIRIPDLARPDDARTYMEKLKALLASELSDQHNRRVNCVHLLTRSTDRAERISGRPEVGDVQVTETIIHANPRFPWPDCTI